MKPPEERSQTVRESLRRALVQDWATAADLSAQVGIREKDVAAHLSHLDRSLKNSQSKLVVDPAACVACGFVFKKRDRLTRPARCPVCDSERIAPPRFKIEAV
jgi:transcriptional regulator